MDEEREYALDNRELEKLVESLCRSKADEFALLGYSAIQPKDVWECVQSKYRKTGMPRLHQLVNDIFSMKVTDYMNWMTMQAYRGEPL